MAFPLVWSLVALAGGTGLYAWQVEPYLGRVLTLDLPCPAWPVAFDGLTILWLSDLHGKTALRGTSLLAWAERLHPDLIVLGGDLADRPRPLRRVLDLCARLRAPLGVYAVLGNHEYRWPKPLLEEVLAELAAVGIGVLRNELRVLERGGARVGLLGLDWARRARWPARLDPTLPLVVLSHGPGAIRQAMQVGAALVLAGHTHGGQICLPFLGQLRSKTGLPRRYESGCHRLGSTWLVVSRGVGESFLPLRFACPPDIVRVRLHRAAEAEASLGAQAAKEAPPDG